MLSLTRWIKLSWLVAMVGAPLPAQVLANEFLDDSKIQVIHLTLDPQDWAMLQRDHKWNQFQQRTVDGLLIELQ